MQNKIWMVGMILIAFFVGLMFSQNTTQAETQDLNQWDVERIIERCTVRVTGEVYLLSEGYGEIQNGRGRISC